MRRFPQAIAFFDKSSPEHANEARCGEIVKQHVGLCYDVCHQAVEFEDHAANFAALEAAGVRVNKVQLSCAVELPDPADAAARRALAAYAEPRYLHQTFAGRRDGDGWKVAAKAADLTAELCEDPPAEFAAADVWRTHFHVPLGREDLGGGLRTTRDDLRFALGAVAALPYAPHLEVETYTWPVLPGEEHSREHIVDGIAAELAAAADLVADLRAAG